MRAPDVRTPTYQRVQGSAQEWAKLGDAYVTNIVPHGVRFDLVPGLDADDPTDDPKLLSLSPYGRSCSDDGPVVGSEVEKLVLAGHVSDISTCRSKVCVFNFSGRKKTVSRQPARLQSALHKFPTSQSVHKCHLLHITRSTGDFALLGE